MFLCKIVLCFQLFFNFLYFYTKTTSFLSVFHHRFLSFLDKFGAQFDGFVLGFFKKSSRQAAAQLPQNQLFPTGNLYLGHAQLLGGDLLCLPPKIPQINQ